MKRSPSLAVHILSSRANQAGGADIYTSQLVKRLPERGYAVTLICHEADDAIRSSCRVVVVDRGSSNETGLIWRFSPVLQLPSVERSLRRRGLDPPDVVLGMAHQIMWAHQRCFGPLPLV